MKVLKAVFIMTIILMIFGCGEQYATKKVSFVDNLIEVSIPDSELVVYEKEKIINLKQDDAVEVLVNGFTYDELKNFEAESYSKDAMKIFYNSDENKYEQLLEYLCKFDFTSNEFAIYSDYGGYGSTTKFACVNSSHKKIMKNSEIIGEEFFYIPEKGFPFSTSYQFIIVTKEKLIDISITIINVGEDSIELLKDFFELKDGTYYWKSEEAKKSFYELLESKEYKKLPKNLQLLRETKDLFLKTLKINE